MRAMHKITVLAFAFLFICLALPAQGAKKAEQAVTGQLGQVKTPPLTDMGGKSVKTDYFSLVIPKGWSMPMPIKELPLATSALFGSVSSNLAVTVNILKTPLSAKEIGQQTLENMRKGGLTTSNLKKKGNMYYADISGKTTGVTWFGSNDGLASAVVILGVDAEKANELLRAIKPAVSGLFPASVR